MSRGPFRWTLPVAAIVLTSCFEPTGTPGRTGDAVDAGADGGAQGSPGTDAGPAISHEPGGQNGRPGSSDAGAVHDGGDAGGAADAGACAIASAACTVDGDCCSGHCATLGRCENGYPEHCSVDGDCPHGMSCLTCIHACVYPAGGACDTAAPCPCGYGCRDGVCSANPADAGTVDCAASAGCPAGLACNPFTFQCQYPMCMVPVGVDLPDGGRATPAPCTPDGGACAAGEQCQQWGGSWLCQRGCSANADCGPDQICGGGGGGSPTTCYADCSRTCGSDADCLDGGFNGRCVVGNCEGYGC